MDEEKKKLLKFFIKFSRVTNRRLARINLKENLRFPPHHHFPAQNQKKGVPAGVRALLESRERHKRRRRPQRIYSKHHDASTHAKILHRSL